MYLSVSLITFNGAAYLEKQLDSILQQSRQVDEIIIVDDGSTDATIPIIHQYQIAHPIRIHLYQNEKQVGSTQNMEKALHLCKGDIIFLADQDDVWMPHKVQTMVDYFETHSNIHAVFSNAALIDKAGNAIQGKLLWDIIGFDIESILQKKPIDLFNFLCRVDNIVTGAGLAIKNTGPLLAQPFPSIEKLLHDAWIALWYAQNNQLAYINENLFAYRIHAAQQMGGKLHQSNAIKAFNTNLYFQQNTFSNFKELKHCLIRLENNKRIQKSLAPLLTSPKHVLELANLQTQLNQYQQIGEKQYPIRLLLRKLKKRLRG